MNWLVKIAVKEYSAGTQAAIAAAKVAIAVADAVIAADGGGTSLSSLIDEKDYKFSSEKKSEQIEAQILNAQKMTEYQTAILDRREQQLKESSEKIESAQRRLDDYHREWESRLLDTTNSLNKDRLEAKKTQASLELTTMAITDEREKLRVREKELSSKVAELDEWTAEIKNNFRQFANNPNNLNDPVKIANEKMDESGSESGREYSILIRNNDRYRSDTHKVSVYKSSHKEGISVVLEVKNERDGMLAYSDYWHYEDSENRLANKLYEELVKVSEDIKSNTEKLIIPVVLISPTFKTSTRDLDAAHREKSTAVNYNYDAGEPKEADWRETLYGPRYPLPKSHGIFQQKFVHSDDKSDKDPVSDGDGRQKVYTYSYSP